MGKVVFDQRVVGFIAQRIGTVPDICTAVGWENDTGKIVAGVIFERFNGRNVYFHGAGDGSCFWPRALLKAIAIHAFETIGALRVTTVTQSNNSAALAWDKAYGFVEEGRMIGAAHDGSDSVYLVLWKHDCKWLSK